MRVRAARKAISYQLAVSEANPMTNDAPKGANDVRAANGDAQEAGSLSQWQLIRERFARHRLAMASLWVLIVLFIVSLGCEFFAPTTSNWRNPPYTYCPPQLPVFTMKDGLHTQVVVRHTDPVTFERSYHYDLVEGKAIPLGFFVEGEPYHLFGLIPGKTHFFGVDRAEWQVAYPDLQAPPWYFLGADRYGHDLFSRIIYGARISLFIGIVAIVITFFLGVSIGGVSGYFGGHTDIVIQRAIEIINGFPQFASVACAGRGYAGRLVAADHLLCDYHRAESCWAGPAWPGRFAVRCSPCVKKTT